MPFLEPGTRPEGVGTERSKASAKKCLAGGLRHFMELRNGGPPGSRSSERENSGGGRDHPSVTA